LRGPVEPGQYTAEDYAQVLDDHHVLASVGTVGDCYANALAESFVDSYKTELIADRVWRTNAQLETRDRRLRRVVQPPPAALLDREPTACRARKRVLGAGRARVRTVPGSGRPNSD
jgi:transposase InsO family protein